jgi:ferredoxin-nitrite reductase
LKKSEPITCPGLFHNTSALDGIIYRIRTPGGIIDSNQCRAIADLAEQLGDGCLQITNRANLQIRAIGDEISPGILKHLQDIALASPNGEVDHLRNIMSSPTAGIDRGQLIDTLPWVRELDRYISNHPHLAELPAKFSVGFDGGETVSIVHLHNEIVLGAIKQDAEVYLRLYLSVKKDRPPVDAGISLRVEECLPVAIALMEVYLEGVRLYRKNIDSSKKPRLRQILQQWGMAWYRDRVSRYLSFPLRCQSLNSATASQNNYFPNRHLGVHAQKQEHLSYMGLVVPLGRLAAKQIEKLADLAEIYGNSILRLTPWQNLLIPDVSDSKISDLQTEIEQLGLSYSPNHPGSGIVACTGNTGCAASATDTKNHALALAKYLEKRLRLDRPLNIHFTGCPKSCAQHGMGNLTLLGTIIQQGEGFAPFGRGLLRRRIRDRTVEGYHVYVGNRDGEEKFGQLLYSNVIFDEIPALIEQILQTNQTTANFQFLTSDRHDP